MLLGGWGGHIGSEIVDPIREYSCQFKPEPKSMTMGSKISATTLMSCDVKNEFHCMIYDLNNLHDPEKTSFKVKERNYATGLNVGDTLWLTGGMRNDKNVDDTELVLKDRVISGPKLPISTRKHCLVKVNETTIALIGGYDQSTGKHLGSTWFYHVNENPWKKVNGPSLQRGRSSHSCATFEHNGETYIIAMMSTSASLRSMEILNIKSNKWIYGKYLKIIFSSISHIWQNI